MRTRAVTSRKGLTLTEVIVSLFIFLFSFAAIASLISVSSERALEAQLKQQGVFLCQSKLTEFARGIEPLQSSGGAAFPHDSSWTWSATCTTILQQEPPLWLAEVKVEHHRPNGRIITVTMSKMMIDPAYRGSTLDPAPQPAAEQTEEGGSTQGQNTGSAGSTTPKQ